jgi:hypothetical protein
MLVPSLKHQDIPERLMPPAFAAQMLFPHFPNSIGIEKPLLPYAPFIKLCLSPFPQRPS